MKIPLICYITLITLLGRSLGQNYCNLCRAPYQPHVACPAPNGFGPACGSDRRAIPMDGNMINLILRKHNQLRSEIALGGYGFPTASRMATLTWDNELATLAGYNAKTCVFAHDKCRNTEAFRFAGQNIAVTKYYGYNYTAEDRVEFFIQAWFDEYKDCSKSYIESYPMNYRGPAIGHFTQLVSDRSWKVGCSLVHYITDGKFINYLFTCNYSMTNMLREPVYKTGSPMSKCTSGQNPEFRGLCSKNERVESVSYNG